MTIETTTDSVLVDAIEAAKMCSMHRTSWYKSVASGKTPKAIRIGGMVRWRRDELLEWIAAGCPVRAKWEAISTSPAMKSGKRR